MFSEQCWVQAQSFAGDLRNDGAWNEALRFDGQPVGPTRDDTLLAMAQGAQCSLPPLPAFESSASADGPSSTRKEIVSVTPGHNAIT